MPAEWLPEPPAGTPICLGFDGSDVNDWTALRAETVDGLQFTPRFGPMREPTIWIPSQLPGGRVSHSQVGEAVDEVVETYSVKFLYYDPPQWATDGEEWALRHGEKRVLPWETYRPMYMHEALERFVTDLAEGRISHDGCPLTWQAMANARMIAKGARYKLAKPADHMKIDPSVASVLAHEAASDARAGGWTGNDGPTVFFL